MLTTLMIGNRIAEARKKINLSQTQLAERLFISSQAVGKWERGESMPDIITFNRLAEILGVDLNHFSENFQPTPTGTAPAGPTVGPSADLPAGRQKKKVGWNMSNGNWVDADFSGLKNLHEKFSGSNLQKCLFIGSDLSGLLLKGNNVDRCDFSRSDLSGSRIQGSNLANSKFGECSLKETEFNGSNIMGCDFSGADFTGAMFNSGGFQNNPATGAVWNRTSFKGMWIMDTVFDGLLESCSFEKCTFKKVTFRDATLRNTFFKDNSLKKIRFVDCRVDNLTYAFLKSGKADLTGITLITQ
jgi:uncharacterized protein YjbI with pentapeptide repeats